MHKSNTLKSFLHVLFFLRVHFYIPGKLVVKYIFLESNDETQQIIFDRDVYIKKNYYERLSLTRAKILNYYFKNKIKYTLEKYSEEHYCPFT